jgi:outer membrane protein W
MRFGYEAGRTMPFVSFGLTATEVNGAYSIDAFNQTVTHQGDSIHQLGTILGVGADYRLTERGVLRIGLSQTWFDDVEYGFDRLKVAPGQISFLFPRTLTGLSVTELTVGYAFEF